MNITLLLLLIPLFAQNLSFQINIVRRSNKNSKNLQVRLPYRRISSSENSTASSSSTSGSSSGGSSSGGSSSGSSSSGGSSSGSSSSGNSSSGSSSSSRSSRNSISPWAKSQEKRFTTPRK